MSNKRNRRGANFFRSYGQSVVDSGIPLNECSLWKTRNEMLSVHWFAFIGYAESLGMGPGDIKPKPAIFDIEAIGRDGRPAVTVMRSTPNGSACQVFQDKYEHYHRSSVRENDVSQNRFEIPCNDWSN